MYVWRTNYDACAYPLFHWNAAVLSVCVVELHVAVSNINMLSVAQEWFYGEFMLPAHWYVDRQTDRRTTTKLIDAFRDCSKVPKKKNTFQINRLRVCGLDSPWPRGGLLCVRQWTFWFRKCRQFSPPSNPTVGFSHGVGAFLSDVVVLALICEWKNRRLCVLITIVRRSLLFIFLSTCYIIIWPSSSKAAVRLKRFHSFVVWRDAWQWM
jgi:hypothetical protein